MVGGRRVAYTESVLEMLSYRESTTSLVWLGPEKTFENQGSQKAVKHYFKLIFANTVNASFNYALIQLLFKHYIVFNSSKTA